MEANANTRRLHPLVAAAAVSVMVFSAVGVAAITGLAVADIETLAAMYGAAKRSFIRIGEGMKIGRAHV